MQAEYKREDHKSFFVISDTRLDDSNDELLYDLDMLCENKIDGLLPITLRSFNGRNEIYYDISSKQPLSILFEKRTMKKEDLDILFRGIEQAINGLDDYLLDMDKLVIDPDYIYWNISEQKIYLLYYPFQEEEFELLSEKFADYILEKICNEDKQTVVYAYNFYRFVKEAKGDLLAAISLLKNSEEAMPKSMAKEEEKFNLDEELFLDSDDEVLARKDPPDNEGASKEKNRFVHRYIIVFSLIAIAGIGIMAYGAWRYQLDFYNLFSRNETIIGAVLLTIAFLGGIVFYILYILSLRKKETSNEEAETVNHNIFENPSLLEEMDIDDSVMNDRMEEHIEIKEDMYETVLIQDNCYKEERILVGKIKGRKKQIDLSTFPFIIGKSAEQADFVIDDSSISRVHARFTLRDDIVYLTDLNSKNGTQKNGIKLQPNELVMLEAGDEIRFGKVCFTYQ